MSQHSINFTSSFDCDVASSADSLTSMLEQECTTYSCHDYLCHNDDDSSTSTSISSIISQHSHCHNSNRITPSDRMRIVDWCYDIVDKFQFDRETVAIAMNIADRFASTNPATLRSRGQYQLVTITALYIAIKLNERSTFGSEDFTAASQGTYTVEDIEDMEIKILHGLSWRLCPPTGLQVGYRILSLLLSQLENTADNDNDTTAKLDRGTWEFLRDEVAFQTESAVRDYFFTTQRPSTTAIAAIMNAIEQVNDHAYEHLTTALLRVLREFAFDSTLALLEAREQLHCLVNEHEEDPYDNDYNDDHDDTISETTVMASPRSLSALPAGSSDASCASVC
mmetsp:Transcript_28432/g.61072  ORF Transcript_28432/g.61072 Transcript_28432/m.61072 type:complete len:338 (+) Transcript_28432:87-1100(+)